MFFGGFPFDSDSLGGGRMHGGPGKDVNNTKYYALLELPQSASTADLKKAYRKLAIKHHPDKGGDPEQFKEISRAYEVLSDPEKRKIYDVHGEAGLEGQMGQAQDPSDIFDLFFGGGRRSKGSSKKRGEDVVTKLKVTLEQVYNGATRRLAINKDVICPDCEGVGGPESAMESCDSCNGQGVRVQIRQIGPMIQQTQGVCPACRGQGRNMPEQKKCKKCRGGGTVRERKILEVSVDKGISRGQKLVFSGEADQKPGEITGDIVFVIEQDEHAVFKRANSDLFIKHSITLHEALLGFKFKVTHLDRRELVINSQPGSITRPGDTLIVTGEGLPTQKNPFLKGNMIVVVDVVFPTPKELGQKERQALATILPAPVPCIYDEKSPNLEVHYADYIDPQDLQRQQEKQRDATAEDSDDEAGAGHGRGVQCRQQ